MPAMLQFLSEDGKESQIQLHPTSINFERKEFVSRWLVYHERVQTTAVYVRDCTPVTPYQLLLFGGSINVQHATGTITLDRWATFAAPPKVAALFREVRASLDRVLSEKVAQPHKSVQELGGDVVSAILKLLQTEPRPPRGGVPAK